MATVDVFDMKKNKVGELSLADEVFGAEVREHLFWEVVKWQQAGKRSGEASTRTRGEIRGSTRKLFRQKGTGRARRGSIKSPVLRGGGTVFGPRPRDFSYTLPKKVRKQALISALSRRQAENGLIVVDKLELPEIKTRQVVDFLQTFELDNVLIVDQANKSFYMSGRNITDVKVLQVEGLNVFDILKHDKLVLTTRAVAAIEGRLKG
jgi:large subunit ribosomal protein L4